jgi:hypothetical protein
MARKRHTAEEIVAKLRQVDVLMAVLPQCPARPSLGDAKLGRNMIDACATSGGA